MKMQRRFTRDEGFACDARNDRCMRFVFPAKTRFENRSQYALLSPGFSRLQCSLCGETRQLGARPCAAGRTVESLTGTQYEIPAVMVRVRRRTEQVDVVDFGSVGTGDLLSVQRLANAPAEIGQLVYARKGHNLSVMMNKIKPVPSPGNVTNDLANFWNLNRDIFAISIARNIIEGDAILAMIRERHDADGSFKPMTTGSNSTEMRERDRSADRAVPAHSEISDVIEENDSRHTCRVGRLAQPTTDEYIRTARLVDDRRAHVIELVAEDFPLLGQSPPIQARPPGDNDTSRFARGVGVDDGNGHSQDQPKPRSSIQKNETRNHLHRINKRFEIPPIRDAIRPSLNRFVRTVKSSSFRGREVGEKYATGQAR